MARLELEKAWKCSRSRSARAGPKYPKAKGPGHELIRPWWWGRPASSQGNAITHLECLCSVLPGSHFHTWTYANSFIPRKWEINAVTVWLVSMTCALLLEHGWVITSWWLLNTCFMAGMEKLMSAINDSQGFYRDMWALSWGRKKKDWCHFPSWTINDYSVRSSSEPLS